MLVWNVQVWIHVLYTVLPVRFYRTRVGIHGEIHELVNLLTWQELYSREATLLLNDT